MRLRLATLLGPPAVEGVWGVALLLDDMVFAVRGYCSVRSKGKVLNRISQNVTIKVIRVTCS